ncbi:MAG: serine hydrolase [Chromatiaceae bacterium]|nr:serine hydrolase [Chromatiaceae bacterium]
MVQMPAALVLLALALLGMPPLWAIVLATLLNQGMVGMALGNAMAAYMTLFARIAGTASAFSGAARFGFGTAVGSVVSLAHDGSARPLLLGMALPGLLAGTSYWRCSVAHPRRHPAEDSKLLPPGFPAVPQDRHLSHVRVPYQRSGPSLTATPMSAADAAVIDELARDALAQNPDLPGLWIGVWDSAKGFYTQASGEGVKGGAKATIDDHRRIGSVTKTSTVVAVLEQVAAGRLKLESRIGEVLPDLATRYLAIPGITVDQLAGVRRGILDYANTGIVVKGVVADPTRVWTADDLIEAAMTLLRTLQFGLSQPVLEHKGLPAALEWLAASTQARWGIPMTYTLAGPPPALSRSPRKQGPRHVTPSPTVTLSLILCDDHTLFREGLASLITREPGWQVLAPGRRRGRGGAPGHRAQARRGGGRSGYAGHERHRRGGIDPRRRPGDLHRRRLYVCRCPLSATHDGGRSQGLCVEERGQRRPDPGHPRPDHDEAAHRHPGRPGALRQPGRDSPGRVGPGHRARGRGRRAVRAGATR